MRLPIVSNEVGGWTDIIKDNNLGMAAKDDPREFAEVIVKLLNDTDKLAESGRRGIGLIKNVYNWDVSAGSYEREL